MFKLEHPANLISRMFILEYMREIGATALYAKADDEQKKHMFYKFTNEEGSIAEVDLNWEALIFEVTIPQLEFFLTNFVEEIEIIEAQRQGVYKEAREQMINEQLNAPTDINIYDIAQADMSNRNKIIGDNGFSSN
jgi:hypothetical protein